MLIESASSAAWSPTRAASAILSASPAAEPSIMAAPGTSTSNGFPAQSHKSLIALFAAIRQRTHPMFDHIMLRTQQLDVMTAFYEQALAPLGIKKLMAFDTAAGFGRDAPGLWISKSTEPRSSVHLALSSPDQSAVRAFHNAALAAGAKDNGAPGPRDFAPNYYAAFVIDPDGNNIEAASRGA
jgi:catechol 2,3-dioxygenase-like lactoylglutathione lyase family enzyme